MKTLQQLSAVTFPSVSFSCMKGKEPFKLMVVDGVGNFCMHVQKFGGYIHSHCAICSQPLGNICASSGEIHETVGEYVRKYGSDVYTHWGVYKKVREICTNLLGSMYASTGDMHIAAYGENESTGDMYTGSGDTPAASLIYIRNFGTYSRSTLFICTQLFFILPQHLVYMYATVVIRK